MKSRVLGYIAAGLGAITISTRGADIMNRIYVIGDIGPNFVQKLGFDRVAGTSTAGFSTDVNIGVRGTVGVGYQFMPALAAELEGGVSYNETKTSSGIIGGVSQSGSTRLWVVPVTAGVTWRPRLAPTTPSDKDVEISYGQKIFQKARPYIGGGIGAGEVFADINLPIVAANSGSGRDTVLSYYAKAGVSVPLSDRIEVGFQYRFHGYSGFTIKDTQSQDIFAHAISATLRINF